MLCHCGIWNHTGYDRCCYHFFNGLNHLLICFNCARYKLLNMNGWWYLPLWLMLMPLFINCFIVVDVMTTCAGWYYYQICDGWCYCHVWQMEWPLCFVMGWCYCPVADGITTWLEWKADLIALVADGMATGSVIFILILTISGQKWCHNTSKISNNICHQQKFGNMAKIIYKQPQKATILWRIFFFRHHLNQVSC